MKIKRLKICNFRCFGAEEKVIELDNLTTLIGINSCGKTAVLYSLMKLFGRSASSRGLERADFHVPKGKNPEDISSQNLYVEAVFSFPELDGDGNRTAHNTIPMVFEHMYVSEPGGEPCLRIRMEARWSSGNTPEGDIDQNYYFITCSESTTDIPEDHKKPASSSDLSNIEFIYIPAIRNPSVQLRNASGTILWRILNGINWPVEIHQNIKTLGKDLDVQFDSVPGFNRLQEILLEEWSKLHSDVRYKNVRIGFNSEDLADLLNKLDVRFSPAEVPGSYNVDALGEGLRSLFYLSLASSLLQLENDAIRDMHDASTQSEISGENTEQKKTKLFSENFIPPLVTILAVEEPENHIAPHLIGRIIHTLLTISNQHNSQVIVTSHSPSIVKRVDPETIRYLRMCPQNQHSLVNAIELPAREDEKFKFVKEAVIAYPEIFFARLVVLGEGDTEEIVIPKALKTFGQALDDSAICVVPLGGRMVNHFWKLLKAIDIPYVTLLDMDLERETGGWARIKYVIEQVKLNANNPDEVIQEIINEKIIAKSDELATLHERKNQRTELEQAAQFFEGKGVFFAFPLDMDFMMLNTFKDSYISTKEDRGGRGPRIPDPVLQPNEYKTKIDDAVKVTLKSEDALGNQYSETEKELMLWYKYLFLERGKPSTHILALSKIEDDILKQKLPAPINRLISYMNAILSKDPQSTLFQY